MKETIMRRIEIFCCIVLLLTAFVPMAKAQTASGSVSGELRDTSNALIQNASLTLTDINTGLSRTTTTDGHGIYAFASVPAGQYHLVAEKDGFDKIETTFNLEIAQQQRFDFQMNVGSVNLVVEVKSDNVAIDTSTSGLGTVISSKEVTNLPMDGRNVFALASLVPGVLPGGGFGAGLSTTRGAAIAAASNNFRANGGVSGMNEILLDGIPVTVCCQGQPALVPNVDIVSQFKVQTNVPPANFGRSSGGILNIITKSGGAAVRGSIYEYMRNAVLDANGWFANHNNAGVQALVYNQFGGTLGGPLWIPHVLDRKKTFFFFGFEGVQSSRSTYSEITVPTPLMRSGDLSEGPGIVYDPDNTFTVGGQFKRLPLPNNAAGKCCIVPANRQNKIALAMMSLWPEPNLPTPQAPRATSNYGFFARQFDSDRQYSGRVDRTINQRYSLLLRGTYSTNVDKRGGPFGSYTDVNSQQQSLRASVIEWDNTIVLTPTMFLNAHYGFSWQANQMHGGGLNQSAVDFGFPGNFVVQQQTPGIPTESVNGYWAISQIAAQQFYHYTHIAGLGITLQRGPHTFQAGWDGRLFLNNVFPVTNGAGSFGYGTLFTVGPLGTDQPVIGQAQYDSFASYLLGLPSGGSISVMSAFAYRQPYSAFYIQDDWRVVPRLTLNLGVRYDLEGGPLERNNKLSQLNPTAANPLSGEVGLPFTGTIEYGGAGRSRRMWTMPLNEFAPRIGFAFNLSNQNVLRGGYGIFYLPTTQRLYDSGNPAFAVTTQYLASLNGGQTAAGSLSNPYPTGIAQVQGAKAGPMAAIGTDIGSVLYNSIPGYVQQWNFGIMSQRTRTTVVGLAYAGAHGVHLPIHLNANDLNPKYFGAPGDTNAVNKLLYSLYPNPFQPYITSGPLSQSTISQRQLLNAFPQYSSVTEQYLSRGSSSYNSLQAILRSQTNYFTATLTYTWSKSIGNVNNNTTSFLDTGSPNYQNSYNLAIERAVDPTDTPQRFTAGVIARLPVGRGQLWGKHIARWGNALVGDWTLTTITTLQSGLPLNVTAAGGPLLSGPRPNRVPGVNPLTVGSIRNRLGPDSPNGVGYLYPGAFNYTLAFQLGNVPRLSPNIRAQGVLNSDISAIKDINFERAWHLQLRGEAFNVFNRVQFDRPASTFGLSTFGAISNQANRPRQVQAAMKLIW
ncbi:MAG TPA: TonB-dependent receptor [Acidisarcina sp.]|nr:TonB-dependent receptor [Acidisarcina sp.]